LIQLFVRNKIYDYDFVEQVTITGICFKEKKKIERRIVIVVPAELLSLTRPSRSEVEIER